MTAAQPKFTLPIIEMSDWQMLPAEPQLRAWAEERGGVVLRGLPDDPSSRRAMAIANLIGNPGNSAVGISRERANEVYEVTPSNGEVKDSRGVTLLSSTFDEIPLHTDGYNAADPPKFLVLQVARPGAAGSTTVAALEDVVDRLSSNTAQLLSMDVYPTTTGTTPILRQDGDRIAVRFNGYKIAEHIRRDHNVLLLEPAHRLAVAELTSLLHGLEANEPRIRTNLWRGDVMVLANYRALHGRSSLDPGDRNRVLHRVWCW